MSETVKALNLLDRTYGAYYWNSFPKGVPEVCALAAKLNVVYYSGVRVQFGLYMITQGARVISCASFINLIILTS